VSGGLGRPAAERETMKNRKTGRSPWVTADPPSPRVLRWVRAGILGGWIAVLLFRIPVVIADARNILNSMPAGAARRAALESVVANALDPLVCLPLFVLAVVGYGIFPRPPGSVWSTGGPWFVPIWRSSKPSKARRSAGPSEDA
jgi:hypothetical protein